MYNFHVNEEKGIIVCVGKVDSVNPKVIIGKAKMSDADVFSIEYGKAIAYARYDLACRMERLSLMEDIASSIIMSTAYNTKLGRKMYNKLERDMYATKRSINNQKRIIHRLMKMSPDEIANVGNYEELVVSTLRDILAKQGWKKKNRKKKSNEETNEE